MPNWMACTHLGELHVLYYQYVEPTSENQNAGAFELIEVGTTHWNEPIGTNESGFTALPGGYRGTWLDGKFL